MVHIPVLIKEVLQYLDPKPNENFIDCTVGEAGHASAILEKNGPKGKVLGIDWDLQQIKNSELLMAGSRGRLILINDSYANLQEIVASLREISRREKKIHPVKSSEAGIPLSAEQFNRVNFKPVKGILLDLGMSSEQLEKSGRGFTFLKDEPLDMRYAHEIRNPKSEIRNLTAEKIVNKWPEKEIERILREYGEEKFARKIAKEIVKKRKAEKIKSTFQLVQIIKEAVPEKLQHGRIHCATKVFQALRIAVNDELGNLKKVLPQAVSTLSSGGRLVIISFHSLEDRIVKNFFQEKSLPALPAGRQAARQEKKGVIKILLKKPVTAEADELNKNPRSRSAKLRAAIKL